MPHARTVSKSSQFTDKQVDKTGIPTVLTEVIFSVSSMAETTTLLANTILHWVARGLIFFILIVK